MSVTTAGRHSITILNAPCLISHGHEQRSLSSTQHKLQHLRSSRLFDSELRRAPAVSQSKPKHGQAGKCGDRNVLPSSLSIMNPKPPKKDGL